MEVSMRKVYEEESVDRKEIKSRPLIAVMILIVGTALLALSMAVSISFGAADISLKTVWQAVFQFDASTTYHSVIQELRLPRAIGGVAVGAFLAVSGAIMQGMTRNPLASPSLMGITDGAVFGIAIMFAFFPNAPYVMFVIASFIGAAFGVAGVKWMSLNMLIPVGLVCLIIAIMLARYITILSFGEEIAIGLGQNTKLIKFIGTILVLVLTGSAVSIAGSVGFVGLVIPHLTRFLVGSDYRWIIPCSAVLGGLLIECADMISRIMNPPFETPIGAVTAMVGVPFFLYLARKEGRGKM